MSVTDEIVDVAAKVARALEAAGVPYLLGGSVAAGLMGEPRATRDIDFAVRLARGQVDGLVRALGDDFSVDEDALLDAIARGRSANIFHLPTVMKVDLFVRGGHPFDLSEFSRRIAVEISPEAGSLYVASPEDNILRKLAWFRMGGEVSDQQWRDVLGMIRTAGPRLEAAYLDEWAVQLGVADLLARAREQAAK